MTIQNRIIGYRVVPASELQAHPDNWRKHPVAGEATRRIVYAVELNPAFVAVALERMAGLGLQPRLVEEAT